MILRGFGSDLQRSASVEIVKTVTGKNEFGRSFANVEHNKQFFPEAG